VTVALKKCYFVLLFVFLFLTSCDRAAPQIAETEPVVKPSIVFIDATGREVSVSSHDRVIVASGSFAHTWLLAGGVLAATTEDAFGEYAAVDPAAVENVGLLKTPSLELILAQEPDLVILSANIQGHMDLYDQLAAAGITAAYFSVETFGEYLDMLKICTDITGRGDLYEQNGAALQGKIDEIISRNAGKEPPAVLLMRSHSSGVSARSSDTMAGAMLKDLGCVNIADGENDLLTELSMEVIIQEDPDYIFVTTMGDSEEKALETLKAGIQANPAWQELSAVKNGRYHVLPKDLFHLKPNDRWPESYEMLADILYGD
jgi:iron complex transport system substrate-binding protein